ncbi:hypothetical protein MtrunA17_Chr4g0005231 [Medicago truncatula]|uniref:Transmembrane protein n=1 Tax=Medicago truncatula TaxID=3880 RepID=A0A396HZD5_MEDTR|nr:hypothetical protein MtrunA17_Chr4g0005231 [Medicago truncatula]
MFQIRVNIETILFTITLNINCSDVAFNFLTIFLGLRKDKAKNKTQQRGEMKWREINNHAIHCCLVLQPLWNTTSRIHIHCLIRIKVIFIQPNIYQRKFIQVEAIPELNPFLVFLELFSNC